MIKENPSKTENSVTVTLDNNLWQSGISHARKEAILKPKHKAEIVW